MAHDIPPTECTESAWHGVQYPGWTDAEIVEFHNRPRKVCHNTLRPEPDASQGGDNRHARRATRAKARKRS